MAYIGSPLRCSECGHNYHPIHNAGSGPTGCPHCTKLKQEKAEQEHMAMLDALSMEERIKRIELWIYNHKPSKPPGSIY